MPRLSRPWSRIAAALAVAALALLSFARSGLGVPALLRGRLSPGGPAPPLKATTAFLFRWLFLWRWIARRNDVGCGLAARYLRRAKRELGTTTPRAPKPVAELEATALDARDLAAWWRRPQPLVVRGLHVAKRDWSLEALVHEFGDTPVLFNDPDGFARRPLRHLRDPVGVGSYVANSERLLAEHPELLEALDVDALRAWTRLHPHCVQLFLGARPRTGLTYHCGNNVNVFMMLHGRKRWTFVDPAWSYFMYPWVTREGAYVASTVGHPEIPAERVPLYAACPRLEVVLEPGDVLVNPPWWWHEVENLDPDTVGCATRWAGSGVPEMNPLFSFAQALSPELWRTTFDTLVALLETGGELDALYRRQAAMEFSPAERISHTREQYEPGALGMRCWPHASDAA